MASVGERERQGGLWLDEGLVVGVYIVEKRTSLIRNKNGQSAWSPVDTLGTLKKFFFECPVGMHQVVYRGVSLEFYLTCIDLVEEGESQAVVRLAVHYGSHFSSVAASSILKKCVNPLVSLF